MSEKSKAAKEAARAAKEAAKSARDTAQAAAKEARETAKKGAVPAARNAKEAAERAKAEAVKADAEAQKAEAEAVKKGAKAEEKEDAKAARKDANETGVISLEAEEAAHIAAQDAPKPPIQYKRPVTKSSNTKFYFVGAMLLIAAAVAANEYGLLNIDFATYIDAVKEKLQLN